MPQYRAFAVCLPGLAPLLTAELSALGVHDPDPTGGGVSFEGDLGTLYRVNLESGLASHVLLRVAEFGARSLADLDKRGARVNWTDWLRPGTQVTIKASCRRSRIYHSGAAEERIGRHLAEQLGKALPRTASATEAGQADQPTLIVRIRIDDNRCQISLDSSGEPLHRRGWRLQSNKAPLREDLARAMVLASGWDQQSPLLDPMMGAGTILIEAATMARKLAPGRLRQFALSHFAIHDAALLATIRATAAERTLPELDFALFGSDRADGALTATRANAERAGVLGDLTLRNASLSACLDGLELPTAGVLVTNPPYGRRLGNSDTLVNLYQTLGQTAAQLPAAWRVTIAAADRRLALRCGLALETAFLADHGGLKVRALRSRDGPRTRDRREETPVAGKG